MPDIQWEFPGKVDHKISAAGHKAVRLKALETLEMDRIGVAVGLIKLGLEINIQQMDALDLERNANGWEKVIHKMWKTQARRNRSGPSIIRRS